MEKKTTNMELEDEKVSSIVVSELNNLDALSQMRLRAQLANKLLLVTKQIGALAKDGRNEHLRYDFISHFQITTAIRHALSVHKVLIVPSVSDYEATDFNLKNTRGDESMWTRIRVEMSFDIIDAETGYYITASWKGSEQDNQGKSFQQAVTICQKYFEMKLFHITDRSDEDPDAVQTPIPSSASKSSSSSSSGNSKDDFWSRLPKNLKYRFDKNKSWIPDGFIPDAISAYKSNPSRERALQLFNQLVTDYALSKTNWMALVTGLELVDVSGNEIPEKDLIALHQVQKEPIIKANENLEAILAKKARVEQGIDAVEAATTIEELKTIASDTFKDIYIAKDSVTAPFLTALKVRKEQILDDLALKSAHND